AQPRLGGCRSSRSRCALMRFISASSSSIFSSRCSPLDFGASLRNLSSAFSTESLLISAIAPSYHGKGQSTGQEPPSRARHPYASISLLSQLARQLDVDQQR